MYIHHRQANNKLTVLHWNSCDFLKKQKWRKLFLQSILQCVLQAANYICWDTFNVYVRSQGTVCQPPSDEAAPYVSSPLLRHLKTVCERLRRPIGEWSWTPGRTTAWLQNMECITKRMWRKDNEKQEGTSCKDKLCTRLELQTSSSKHRSQPPCWTQSNLDSHHTGHRRILGFMNPLCLWFRGSSHHRGYRLSKHSLQSPKRKTSNIS